MDNRKSLIAKIHIGKSKLAMDDETYRQLLQNTVNKTSCSEMTVLELIDVLKVMQRKGFKIAPSRYPKQGRSAPAAVKEKYLRKITALLTQYKLPPIYADGLAKKAFNIYRVHWLSVLQLKKVIQMLEVYNHRQQKKA